MSGFLPEQVKALSAKLSERHIRRRTDGEGRSLDYIEGWHAISEANRIFGFDSWDRETLEVRKIDDAERDQKHVCSYMARVRISVRAGGNVVSREGMGVGHGVAAKLTDAFDIAIKAAETDATKRALSTFGNQFGLALYDSLRRGVRRSNRKSTSAAGTTKNLSRNDGRIGDLLASKADPRREEVETRDYCATVRDALQNAGSSEEIAAIWKRHEGKIIALRFSHPTLMAKGGRHVSDALASLYNDHLRRLTQGDDDQSIQSAKTNIIRAEPTARGKIDKSQLAISAPKRIRNKAHLKFVGSQPCLVCGRAPSDAHHLRFAQPKAVGLKAGDDHTVPLCRYHHRALHAAGDERLWWTQRGQDPTKEAERLWLLSRQP